MILQIKSDLESTEDDWLDFDVVKKEGIVEGGYRTVVFAYLPLGSDLPPLGEIALFRFRISEDPVTFWPDKPTPAIVDRAPRDQNGCAVIVLDIKKARQFIYA